MQCIKSENLLSQPLPVSLVPQGSILRSTRFSIYINNPFPDFVLNALQQSFLSVQQAFYTLNLVLNTSKTKVMWFGKKNAPLLTCVITTSEGLELEVVTSNKYLGVWLDGTLSFSQHISKL